MQSKMLPGGATTVIDTTRTLTDDEIAEEKGGYDEMNGGQVYLVIKFLACSIVN